MECGVVHGGTTLVSLSIFKSYHQVDCKFTSMYCDSFALWADMWTRKREERIREWVGYIPLHNEWRVLIYNCLSGELFPSLPEMICMG